MDRDDLILTRRIKAGYFVRNVPGLNVHLPNTEGFGWAGELRTFDGLVLKDTPLKIYSGGAFGTRPIMVRMASGHWGYVENHKEFAYLDNLYPSYDTGFSLRKLRSDYSGFCLQVRRSSDNTTQDIGFLNNAWDVASLLSFVGTGDGFVSIWYGQYNTVNLTQTVLGAQPQIVSAGSPVTFNERPCLKFGTAQNMVLAAARSHTASDHSFWVVYGKSNGAVNDVILLDTNTNYVHLQYGSTFYSGDTAFAGFNIPSNTTHVNSMVESAGIKYVFKNGRVFGSATDSVTNESWSSVGIDTEVGWRNSDLYISEIITSATGDLQKRALVENNINKYYSIYA